MGLIKTAGVLITQNRFSKDDNGIYGVGNTAGGRHLWNKDKLHNWRQQDEIQRLNKRVDIFDMTLARRYCIISIFSVCVVTPHLQAEVITTI